MEFKIIYNKEIIDVKLNHTSENSEWLILK